MQREELAQNIAACRGRLAEAGERWGGVEICAVTKTVDAETINLAFEEGLSTIGENRVQELTQKLPALNPQFHKHLIGQLQTNKVKYIISCVDMVQSLDRVELARELSARALRAGRIMPVLVQVNIAGEPQKAGVPEDGLLPLLREAAQMEGIRVQGLMAIMPLVSDPEQVRPCFRRMRAWFDRLKQDDMVGIAMQTLSMGMSGDCLVAAQEGSTMVRLGSALFGRRAL